ncbi:unnamed protein product [Rotaria sordida]|uniref:Uncharacterized protein n=1 Tax=Rotaria sordida TaxID=392033 RepID=A0A814VSR9_9BILA|nr:unnamed protein product [Rotaria sordida]CAF1191999.1 unnamed protein product [Rotaria sordida]CAF3654811.1 unnamed protein product [Rotaria sordida]CAF3786940.1 unnamed protein product [Rotaria sordida]
MFHTIQRQLKLFLLITCYCFNFIIGSPDQLRLLKHLLPNNRYKPIARPVQNDSHTLLVTINLSLQQIINFDGKNEAIVISGWMTIMWNDYSLRWKPEDFGNIQTLRIPSTQIWIPDIFLYNTADEKFDTRAKVNAVVQYDGVNLTVESSKGQLDAYVKSAEWDLEDFSATNNVTKYDCCPNMYPYVLYTIRMRRRSLYYFTSIVVPCFLISCMTPLGFLLSPDSGEKLTLRELEFDNLKKKFVLIHSKFSDITTLLTVVMFSLLLSEILPPSSNAIPIITVYFMCIMIMSAVSVVASVLVLSLHLRNSSNYTMPSWVRNYICNYLAWLLRMKRPNHDLSWRAIRHRWTFSKQESNNINGSIDNHHHSKISSEPLLNNTFELLSTNVINVDKEPLEFAVSSVTEIHGSRHHQNTSNELYTCNMEMIRSELRIIISQLAILINYFQQKEKDANESQDWQFVAMVIDRLCLVIFTVIMLLFTALTFLNV